MAILHFKKALLNHPHYFNGAIVSFIPVGNNVGVAEVNDATNAPLATELEKCSTQRTNGIVRISPEIYKALLTQKKTDLPMRPSSGVFSQIREFKQQSLYDNIKPLPAAVSAGAVIASPQPPSPAPAPLIQSGAQIAPQVNPAPMEATPEASKARGKYKPTTRRKSDVTAKVDAATPTP